MTITLSKFVSTLPLRFKVKKTFHNPHMEDSDNMDHWKCILRNTQTFKQMTLTFSKGLGLKGEPATLEEVLDCLASDASGYENAQDFEDWCSEYGYDINSWKAEKIYHTIGRQAKQLRSVLGKDLYDTLLWTTERL